MAVSTDPNDPMYGLDNDPTSPNYGLAAEEIVQPTPTPTSEPATIRSEGQGPEPQEDDLLEKMRARFAGTPMAFQPETGATPPMLARPPATEDLPFGGGMMVANQYVPPEDVPATKAILEGQQNLDFMERNLLFPASPEFARMVKEARQPQQADDEYDQLFYKTGKTKSEREELNRPLHEAMQVPLVSPETIARGLRGISSIGAMRPEELEQGPIEKGVTGEVAKMVSGLATGEGAAALPLYMFPPTAVGLAAGDVETLPADVSEAVQKYQQGDTEGATAAATRAAIKTLMSTAVIKGAAHASGPRPLPAKIEALREAQLRAAINGPEPAMPVETARVAPAEEISYAPKIEEPRPLPQPKVRTRVGEETPLRGEPERVAREEAVPGGGGAPEAEAAVAPGVVISPEETGASAAGLEAAQRVEDFIPSPQALRITPFRTATAEDVLAVPKSVLKSTDPRVETRWKDATRVERSLAQKAREAAIALKNEFTRADPYLDPRTDAPAIDVIRRFRTIPRHSQELAANIIRGFTAGLGKNKFEVYQRNIILNDLARDVGAGRYESRELPFGYTPETLMADTAKFQQLARQNPLVEKALDTRNKFMDTLKRELVENDLLPEKVLQEGDYFHRQVVEHLNQKDAFTTGVGSDVRTKIKGFQRERKFSSKDYNTKYLEAEYEVITQALGQLRTKRTLAELKTADIKPQLMSEAKASGTSWEELVPDDHAIWQPKEGNVFYRAMTLPEKVIDGILKGDRELLQSDLREVLAMGGAREQWVIPKRLAKTLDNVAPKIEEGAISDLARKATNGWKVWTLLNPMRSVKYGLNNLSGDLDITAAYSPKIAVKYGPKAAADMYRYVIKRGAISPEISEGIEKGVLSSGFSVAEVPDISSHQYFRVMSGENPSLIERAWQKNKDYHTWRENVLRLSAWRFFKDKLGSAKAGERFYAASRKSEIDGLYDAGASSSDISAKLARELVGDYGNISHAGQWIRSHAIPFYSWMEINAPRYVRLLKNAAAEGEGNVAGRAAGVIAKRVAFKAIGKTTKTAGLAAGMYALVNLWNHTMYPKEEAELGEGNRQLHLILGRNEDGTIKTFRIQGALSDALSWAGAEDLPSDIRDITEGKATIGEKAIEAVKAPPTKVISGVTPFVKTPVEALTQRSLFPDPFNPRPIRDPAETIARMFSLEKPYRYFTDKPMRPVMNEIADMVTYTSDPGEAAYHMTRGLVANWQSKRGDERASIIPTQRQNALFYYKKATQLGETEKAGRWKKRYMDMGGKQEGLEKSVAASAPLGSLSQERKKEFLRSLNPQEREVVKRSEDWFRRIYGNSVAKKMRYRMFSR